MLLFTRIAFLSAVAIAAPAVATTGTLKPAQLAQAQLRPHAPAAAKPISKAAFTTRIDARFQALDANKDGSLSKTEIAAGQAQTLQQAQTMEQRRVEAQFKRLDTNNDGSLTIAEFRAAAPTVRVNTTPDQMLGAMDSNKDGKISAAEYRAAPLANFDRLDANKDNVVSPQEARAARRR